MPSKGPLPAQAGGLLRARPRLVLAHVGVLVMAAAALLAWWWQGGWRPDSLRVRRAAAKAAKVASPRALPR